MNWYITKLYISLQLHKWRSYDDEVWQMGPAIDKTDPYNWRAEIQKSHVGKYQVEVHAEEEFGQETIDRFITK